MNWYAKFCNSQVAEEQLTLFDMTPPKKKPEKPAPVPIHPYYKKYEYSPLFRTLWKIRPQLAAAAQKVYDEWEQGPDDPLNGGGICQDIAAAIADVISRATRYQATTLSATCGEQHVWCVTYTKKEAYNVDIPFSTYETGGGYSWKKIPDVTFDANDITFDRTDPPGPDGYGDY